MRWRLSSWAACWMIAAPSAVGQLTVVSAASFAPRSLAPGSAAAVFGRDFVAGPQAAASPSLAYTLGGATVSLRDNAGRDWPVGLYYVSPAQLNIVVPDLAAIGPATVTVVTSSKAALTAQVQLDRVSPGIFSANASGTDAAAAQLVRQDAQGRPVYSNSFTCGPEFCVPAALEIAADDTSSYLVLYGTGIRGRTSPGGVRVQAGDTLLDVLYAGPQGAYPGLDQINVRIPAAARLKGIAAISVTVDGVQANNVTILLGDGAGLPGSPVVEFDPSLPEIGPFPTDSLTVSDSQRPTGRRVSLPLRDCAAQPSTCLETSLINELDGFGLQTRISIAFSSPVDARTIAGGVFLLPLTAGTRRLIRLTQIVYDPATNRAYGRSAEVLDQNRRYGLLVTTGVRDRSGVPISADPRYLACLVSVDPACGEVAALVSSSATQAAPERIVAASVFTTLNATSWMQVSVGAQAAVSPNYQPVGSKSLFEVSRITSFVWRQDRGSSGGFSDAPIEVASVLGTGVRKLAFGAYTSPSYLGSNNTIRAAQSGTGVTPSAVSTQQISVHIYLPAGDKPASGYPVVIFGHGYTDNNLISPTVVAGTFGSAGMAVIAINAHGHGFGPRSTVLIRENGVDTSVPAAGRGIDANGDGRIDAGEGCLALFGLRDCIRQTAVDLSQLVHAIRLGIDVDGDGSPDLDGNKISYCGVSFGAIYGTVFAAVEPAVRAVVLNVGGGSTVDIQRTSPVFHAEAVGFLGQRVPSLLNRGNDFDEQYPAPGAPAATVTLPGAIEIQDFFERVEWLRAIGDPVSFAPHLFADPLPGVSPKPVLWQFALGDQTIPNATTFRLIGASRAAGTTVLYRFDLAKTAQPALPDDPHPFLVDVSSLPAMSIATAAQVQAAGFLYSQGAVIPDVGAFTASYFPSERLLEVISSGAGAVGSR